ncbi:DUF4123 domain-containing protein [Pseudomonas plecoglossicida]|uniref:DUF4123 domain-containing protein n=1 Tax=Pseudomonas plecoglossicida TaxID=70775 RepID=UPI003D23B0CC
MTPFATELVEQLRQAPDHRLMAIVELARLQDSERQQLQDRFADDALPILYHEQFTHLRHIGPWLFSPGQQTDLQSQYDFHCTLTEMAGDALCGWLVSAQTPSRLVHHLGQGITACGPDGDTFLLRFYTEQAFPILHARHDLPGIAHLLAPIRSWWIMEPHSEHKAWRHFAGYDLPQFCGVPLIQLDQTCWDALDGDPMSYHLADQLQELLGASLSENCHGARIGHVRKLVTEAREKGLTRPGDQSEYVTLLTQRGPDLLASLAWQEALAEARDHGRPLAIALQARLLSNPD